MHKLYSQWKKDEKEPFVGWNFSYIKNRLKAEEPPWNYKKEAKKLIKKSESLLDIGTGGGEFFSSLDPFPKRTVAAESWPPNVPIARKRLSSLGVKVVATDKSGKLPLKDNEFDLALNRHSYYRESEVFRVIKKNAIFFTQQVGGDNLIDLAREFDEKSKFKEWNVKIAKHNLEKAGFTIKMAEEWSGKTEFKDVGAIVYTLKSIPWIVKGFTVEEYLPVLEKFQDKLDKGKKLSFLTTKFLIKAIK